MDCTALVPDRYWHGSWAAWRTRGRPLFAFWHAKFTKYTIQVDENLARRYSESYFRPEGEVMVMSVEARASVRRVRDLELEVEILRRTLAATPAAALQDQQWKDEVVRLLAEVALFRLALDRETVLSSLKNK